MDGNERELKNLILAAARAAGKAGDAILAIYHSGFSVSIKEDKSPLTEADTRSHSIICAELSAAGYPILSEEGKSIPFSERSAWKTFWLVDPLDGTREFINRNGEFTINIALVEEGKPVLGVVYAPVPDVIYFGAVPAGAYKAEKFRRGAESATWEGLVSRSVRIPRAEKKAAYTVVASRSHMSPETEKYIDGIRRKHETVELLSRGSSLKICLVAEGLADEYPRFGPTMEWDTAAGHALSLAAGKEIVMHNSGKPLRYNKENLMNPWFRVK